MNEYMWYILEPYFICPQSLHFEIPVIQGKKPRGLRRCFIGDFEIIGHNMWSYQESFKANVTFQ